MGRPILAADPLSSGSSRPEGRLRSRLTAPLNAFAADQIFVGLALPNDAPLVALDEHFGNRHNRYKQIWVLFMLQKWLEHRKAPRNG